MKENVCDNLQKTKTGTHFDDDCTIVSCRVHLVPLPSSCVPLQLIKSIIEPNKRDNKAATYASATYNSKQNNIGTNIQYHDHL